jgi:ribosomal peptide maturation radical SAM protein 1
VDNRSLDDQGSSVITLGAPQRLLLICPPFQSLVLSSLATAQLATLLRTRGIFCAEAYLHFDFARLIGEEQYSRVSGNHAGLRGELLFAEGLHGTLEDPEAIQELLQLYGPPDVRADILSRLRQICLARIVAQQPDIVGMSTSFSQLLPSLWIARVIKQTYPDTRIVLGGAACSEPMGQRIVENYSEADFVVSGYGENPLLALGSGNLPKQRFIRSHDAWDLDALPIPEYDTFLEEAREFRAHRQFSLTFESSRGCWWGQKNHCTFCGLNGLEMKFTAKSNERVVAEVRTLWEKYHQHLYATDTIMSREHLRTVMVQLGTFKDRPDLFYEVKANMTEADVVTLKRAGANELQPGIESLSTHSLTLLKKGISAIRNLALLKWCREREVSLMWNLLCAIPGERSEDYDQQLLLIDKIPTIRTLRALAGRASNLSRNTDGCTHTFQKRPCTTLPIISMGWAASRRVVILSASRLR